MLNEFVRGQLRNALYDLPMTQKGQIAIMSDTAAGDSYSARPVRMVESEGSMVETEAEPVRYHEGKRYKQNKPLIHEAAFQSAIWRQAANKVPDPWHSWLKYCYGDVLRFDHQVTICKEVWIRYTAGEAVAGLKKMSGKTCERVQALTWLAVQVAVSEINGGIRKYSNVELSHMLGVKPDNWQKNYLPRWALLISACHDFDKEVILHVARQLRKESNRRRDSRLSM